MFPEKNRAILDEWFARLTWNPLSVKTGVRVFVSLAILFGTGVIDGTAISSELEPGEISAR